MFSLRDPDYNHPAGRTFASALRNMFSDTREAARTPAVRPDESGTQVPRSPEDNEPIDNMAALEQRAVDAIKEDAELKARLESQEGMPWYGVQKFIMDAVLVHVEDSRQLAYNMLGRVLSAIYGKQGQGWETFRHSSTGKMWVRCNK
jgi:uncharacterized protein